MALEETEAEEVEAGQAGDPRFTLDVDFADPSIQDVHVHNAFTFVGDDDVCLLLGTELPGTTNKFRPIFRAFMSHDTFIALVAGWSERAELLQKAYDGNPTSLRRIKRENPELLAELYSGNISGENEEKDEPEE